MEVLLNKVMLDVEGGEAKDEKGNIVTLRKMIMYALSNVYPDEVNLGGEEKFTRFELYLKIKNGSDPVDLTVDEIVLLKKVIAKGNGPLFMGQAWMMLENKA